MKHKICEMNLPELEKFTSITLNIEDLKDKVNQLQSKKRQVRLSLHVIQDDINKLISEIDKLEKESDE